MNGDEFYSNNDWWYAGGRKIYKGQDDCEETKIKILFDGKYNAQDGRQKRDDHK